MISRPAMVPAVRLEQPQVRLPALSKGDPHAMHRRTLIVIADKPASLRAIFFCSMSLTTLGGRVLMRAGSKMGAGMVGLSADFVSVAALVESSDEVGRVGVLALADGPSGETKTLVRRNENILISPF